jgi:cold-inducible RNA-binding protein
MGNRVYVGNLSYSTNEEALRSLFETNGRRVVEVKLVTDRDTGRARGFGFVEFETPSQAQKAIEELNDREVDGRRLVVNLAQDRSGSSGGGGGRGGSRGRR